MDIKRILLIFSLLAGFSACSEKSLAPEREEGGFDEGMPGGSGLLYILNEGCMGRNSARLDVLDLGSGKLSTNVFPKVNPGVAMSLGDVGNDLKIYGSKMYATISCSNLVEVMDAATARHLGAIEIPGCRSLCFDGDYAYVSSFAGKEGGGTRAEGHVAKIDTLTLKVVARCEAGYQPEDMAVSGGRLYVANSGGYRAPDYDDRVSVINLGNFSLEGHVRVAPNLHHLLADRHGQLWVSSRGDLRTIPSSLHRIIPAGNERPENAKTIRIEGVSATVMDLRGDSLHVIGGGYLPASQTSASGGTAGREGSTYTIVDVRSCKVLEGSFISRPEEIKLPYGIAADPVSELIFITDAGDYVTSGKLLCFDGMGNEKGAFTLGEIPAHMAFWKRRP
ncbi:MAG: YncE family protein [Bacteroidales bacterium]|nr:YncE family protein [Bacteroidales bacterium]